MKLIDFHNEWQKLQFRVQILRESCSSTNTTSVLSALLVAGEDHRFQYHFGVDPIALCRATWRSVFCRRREGGSTIAMQLVRVLTGKYENTLSRKTLEIYLAVKLTNLVPKNEIPVLYLSVAYYGWKMNGLGQACARLSLDPTSMSFQDAASIIARLKYPEPRHSSPSRIRKINIRTNHIMRRYKELFTVTATASPRVVQR